MEYKKSRWEIEYDKFNENKEELKSKMAAIRREQATLKEGPEYAAKKKELDELRKTQIKYDKIEKNKDKIENILKFKMDLVNKTSELLDKKAEFDKINQTIEKCEKAFEKLDKERDTLLKEVQQIDIQLKDPDLKDEDRKKLEDERKSKIASVSDNNTKYSEVANTKDDFVKKLGDFDKDKINEELLKNEKLISKCDLIGANLLKGKSMEEISAKLENFEFKPNKDFAKKVQEMREMYGKEAQKGQPEEEKPEEEKPGEEKPGEEKPGEEKPGVPEPEVEELEDEEPETEYPTIISKFSQWFSRLKENIRENGFINGVINTFRREEIEEEPEVTESEVTEPEVVEPEVKDPEVVEPEVTEPLKTNDDFEYAMKKLDGKDQDKVLEEIAEKGTSGFRESVKVSKQEILANMKKQGAKEYAEKYGGRYETQDGAELDK